MTGTFDLFDLFVNSVFGDILLSVLGIGFVYFIVGIMGKMSVRSIIIIEMFFFVAMLVGIFGGIVALPLFIFCSYYFISGLLNWLGNIRG